MEVGYRLLLEKIGGLATVRVIRQRPFLKIKVSASLEDVHSRYLWLKDILDTAPAGHTWVATGGLNSYEMELWKNEDFAD